MHCGKPWISSLMPPSLSPDLLQTRRWVFGIAIPICHQYDISFVFIQSPMIDVWQWNCFWEWLTRIFLSSGVCFIYFNSLVLVTIRTLARILKLSVIFEKVPHPKWSKMGYNCIKWYFFFPVTSGSYPSSWQVLAPVLAKTLVTKSTYKCWQYCLKITEPISRTNTRLVCTPDFVLISMHFLSWIQIWQWKFESWHFFLFGGGENAKFD